MASTFSPSAIHQVIFLLDNDDRPIGKEKEGSANDSLSYLAIPRRYSHVLRHVNSKWEAVYKLYMDVEPGPPLGYFDSLELGLVFKGEVDDANVHAIFEHGKPLEFWGCPRLLVSKLVEVFSELQTEPTFLDVTIVALPFLGVMRASEAWPRVYTTHLPCYACSTIETIKGRRIPQDTSRSMPASVGPNETADFVVEKFHISSKCFRKRLTLELHYRLWRGTAENERG